MAIIEKFKLDGARELFSALKGMEKQTQISVVRKSARRAMIPVRDAIASNISSKLDVMNPQARAIYAKQIQIRTKFDRKKGSINVFVMPNVKKMQNDEKKRAWREALSKIGNEYKPSTFTNFGYLAHFFEGGVSPHVIKIKRKKSTVRLRHPGFKGTPIYENTFNAKANGAATRFIKELGDQLAKEFNRQNKVK